MSLFKTITRGGQVHLHQWRMLKQVFVVSVLLSLLIGGIYTIWEASRIPHSLWKATYEVTWARIMLATTPDTKHQELSQVYTTPKRKTLPQKVLECRQRSSSSKGHPVCNILS